MPLFGAKSRSLSAVWEKRKRLKLLGLNKLPITLGLLFHTSIHRVRRLRVKERRIAPRGTNLSAECRQADPPHCAPSGLRILAESVRLGLLQEAFLLGFQQVPIFSITVRNLNG